MFAGPTLIQSALMRTRRLAARVLPAPAKRVLRRVLPARLMGWMPRTRRFALRMPEPPPGLGPTARPAAQPPSVVVEAPWRSYVPRLLHERGVGAYEPETMAAFLGGVSFLEAREAFDIGANVGVFSIVAAATTTAHVTGFEPTPALAATFRTIARTNQLSCEVESIALGRETGTATLFLSAQSDSSNSLRKGFRTATGTVEVPVERLDDYVARTGRRPAIMKVDTETTEPDVFAGGLETIKTQRPWIICEILAGKTEAPVEAVLGSLGYRFHHLAGDAVPRESPHIVGDSTYANRDWLFTPGPLPEGFGRHFEAWLQAIRRLA